MFVRRSALENVLKQHERERERWDRERAELLDRIMYLSDRPWGPPPAPPVSIETPKKEKLYLEPYEAQNGVYGD